MTTPGPHAPPRLGPADRLRSLAHHPPVGTYPLISAGHPGGALERVFAPPTDG
jgi:hypothetical protein